MPAGRALLLHDFLDYHARVRSTHPFLVDGGRRLDYGEAVAESRRIGRALLESGLSPQDRVCMLSKNSADVILFYLGASRAGIVPVPLNWRLAPAELAYIIGEAGARAVVAHTSLVPRIEAVRGSLPPETNFYVLDGEAEGWRDYRAWIASASSEPLRVEVDADFVLYQMYTSGTTGRPKGAMLTQHSVVSNAVQCAPVINVPIHEQDRALVVMPLFHAGATSFAFNALVGGATLVIHREFNARALIDALSGDITIVNVVPAMLQMAMNEVPDIAMRDYGNLRTIIYGASPIAEDTLRKALAIFGCAFAQGFGQTEASAVLTFLTHADHLRALAGRPALLTSAGRPVAGTELAIVDAEDRQLPQGQVGEIVARGPQVMKGYWNNEAETAAALRGGWLHTGDAGYLDAEGYLYICDRIKDMIVSGGENVYPREIENVLLDHPDIVDAAVIGIPDETYGETVLAFIVRAADSGITAEDVAAHCRAYLAGYKLPRAIEFVDTLPRNTSGKILKRELRAPYWQNAVQVVR